MKRAPILFGLIVAAAVIVTVKSCRYDWNPHYLSNEAVEVNKIIYSPDSSVAVVNYSLGIGARGFAEYQTLLRRNDFQHDLSRFLLPNEYTSLTWKGNDTLGVVFDEYAGMGGPLTDLDCKSDVALQNGIVIIITQRKMNKWQILRQEMRGIGAQE